MNRLVEYGRAVFVLINSVVILQHNNLCDQHPPLLTIVLATLNAGKTIGRCLESIVSQTFRDFELIVMDGGSTDDTLEILSCHRAMCVHLESAKDNGIYSAWNRALAKAKGSWIMFIGADDYLSHDAVLAELMEFAGQADADLVTVRNAEIDSDGKQVGVYGEPWSWERFRNHMNICHVGVLHHRTLFERFGKFDEQYKIAGDYELLMRAGKSLRARDYPEVVACCGNGGVSHNRIAKAFFEAIKLQQKHRSAPLVNSIVRYGLSYSKIRLKGLIK